jgi:hypothetical protein
MNVSRPNRCSSRSSPQTPRLPAKSCGPTSMTSPAGTTAGRRRMMKSTLHCARTPASTLRCRPACSSLPVSATRFWVARACACCRRGSGGEAALRYPCSPRPWAPACWASWNVSPVGTVCQYCDRTPATTSLNPAGPIRPSATRRRCLQRRPVRRALVGKAADLEAAGAKAALRRPIASRRLPRYRCVTAVQSSRAVRWPILRG